MKNNIFYILLSVILLLTACEVEDNFQYLNLGTEFYITTGSVTSLDSDVTIDIKNPLQNLTEVTVFDDADDSNLGTITISGEAGSITFTTAALGLAVNDDAVDLRFDAVYNGIAFSRYASINMDDPISISAPDVYETDDIEYIYVDVETAGATVSTVTAQIKIGVNGTYAAFGSFNASDSIALVGTDYLVDDTVYVKVTATAGTKSTSSEVSTVIMTNAYGHTMTAMLDTTTNQAFDFIDMEFVNVATAGDSADISFLTTDILGSYNVGFAALNNAEFVVSDAATYALGDIVVIEATDFTTPDATDNVAEGDVFIFRTMRAGDTGYTYGIMIITDIVADNDDPSGATLTFEFKY